MKPWAILQMKIFSRNFLFKWILNNLYGNKGGDLGWVWGFFFMWEDPGWCSCGLQWCHSNLTHMEPIWKPPGSRHVLMKAGWRGVPTELGGRQDAPLSLDGRAASRTAAKQGGSRAGAGRSRRPPPSLPMQGQPPRRGAPGERHRAPTASPARGSAVLPSGSSGQQPARELHTNAHTQICTHAGTHVRSNTRAQRGSWSRTGTPSVPPQPVCGWPPAVAVSCSRVCVPGCGLFLLLPPLF